MSDTIEPGTPFPEVLAAIQDARAAWTIAARNQILGNDQLVRFDLDHIEEALERAMCAYDRDADRTVAWLCPGCSHRWDRNAKVGVA